MDGPGGEGAVRYSGVARVELPLPPAETRTAIAPSLPRTGNGADPGAAHDMDQRATVALDPSLIEDGPSGRSQDRPGRSAPLFAYARPFNFEDRRPKVAVMILGLGLRAELFDAALALPGPIGLQLSPYAPTCPPWSSGRAAPARGAAGFADGAHGLSRERPGAALLADNSPEENLSAWTGCCRAPPGTPHWPALAAALPPASTPPRCSTCWPSAVSR